uniref:Cyclin N-terminal domain-containing protein n=1 Tax=Mycena chlorophos TaxID=658473 RepID=A0ABQ0KWC8_MYCCL|nr:predicted protein [Mycena chlorophos]
MRHPASLVDPATHSQQVMRLVDIDPCSDETIDYYVGKIVCAAQQGLKNGGSKKLVCAPVREPFRSFAHFVRSVMARAQATPATMLTSLVYVERIGPRVQIRRAHYAFERIFLGALLVADKYTNDSTIRNRDWALCTRLFRVRHLQLIERGFLKSLHWDLRVTEMDLLRHYEGLAGSLKEKP